MQIDDLPFEFYYDARQQAFQLTIGGGGVGGVSILGSALTDSARTLMQSLATSGVSDRSGTGTSQRTGFTSHDLALVNRSVRTRVRQDAQKIIQLVRSAASGQPNSGLAVRSEDLLCFR